MAVKTAIVIVPVEDYNPWAAADVPAPSPLPRAPALPPSWHVRKCGKEAFQLGPDDGNGRPDYARRAFIRWLGLEQDVGGVPHRAFELHVPDGAVPFYRSIIDNAFFWATVSQLRQVRNAETVVNRDATWHARAGQLITAWEALYPGEYTGEKLRAWGNIAGFDFISDAEATSAADMEVS